MSCFGVDVSKVEQGNWDYESTGLHSRPVPIVTKSERDLLRYLEQRKCEGQEAWLLRELSWKIEQRDRFLFPEASHG